MEINFLPLITDPDLRLICKKLTKNTTLISSLNEIINLIPNLEHNIFLQNVGHFCEIFTNSFFLDPFEVRINSLKLIFIKIEKLKKDFVNYVQIIIPTLLLYLNDENIEVINESLKIFNFLFPTKEKQINFYKKMNKILIENIIINLDLLISKKTFYPQIWGRICGSCFSLLNNIN